jgi:hypothetical protein
MNITVVFDLGTVLSITTDVLLTKIENVYEILNYMTGDNLFTHQLPRVSREMKQVILDQFPQLAEIDASGVDTTNWEEFLNNQIEKYGNEFPIFPCGISEHKVIDFQQEAIDMLNGDESKINILILPDNNDKM